MPTKIAILGTGGIADKQLTPALSIAKGGVLWSVLSRDLKRAREFAESHQARSPNPAHDDIDVLLADPELDAVIIATPDGLHAAQTLRAPV